jgi:hypothetical protein
LVSVKNGKPFSKGIRYGRKKSKKLYSTLEKIFIRKLQPKISADKVVFFLGRLCVEDFNEVFLLCANGYGFGGLKIIRGLYERAVTSGYIAENPSEAETFLEYHFIHKGKMLHHAREFIDINKRMTKSEIEETERRYAEYKEKFKEPLCKKCGTYRTKFSWSELDTASMAQKIGLGNLYFPGYFYPTLQTHATPSSLMARLIMHDEDNASFDESSQREWADTALITAHNIIISVLKIQNIYFTLMLDNEIKDRENDFAAVWG